MEKISTSVLETKRIGKNLAKKILQEKKNRALVICLKGDLGGGKTTFVQGFAKGLGVGEKILSPTFVIMRKFRIFSSKKDESFFKHLYHIDCYRLRSFKEIVGLGFSNIISDPRNIVIIEWADRIEKILPSCNIFIEFRFVNKKTRKIIIKQNAGAKKVSCH